MMWCRSHFGSGIFVQAFQVHAGNVLGMGKISKAFSDVGQTKEEKSKFKGKGKPKEGILKGKVGSLPEFDSSIIKAKKR